LSLGGLALFAHGFYGIAQGSTGLGNLVEMGLGVVLFVLAGVKSARIVKAQKEKEINKLIGWRLQHRW
jgi:hypothetical protein